MQVAVNALVRLLPVAVTDMLTGYVFPIVTLRPDGLDSEALAAFPGLMPAKVSVAVPESPVMVTEQVVICMFPLFLIVAATRVFEPALTMSIDCIWMSSVELIVPTMLETSA